MGQFGIFDTAPEAVAAAAVAQKDLVNNFTLEDRSRFIAQIRKEIEPRLEEFGIMEYEETGYGRLEDKAGKNVGAVMLTPGPESLPTGVMASDKGLTIEYYAPFGVIGAITPVTNPVATIASNTISITSGGNAVVFNAHPASVKCATTVCEAVNRAIVNAGGPDNLATMPAEPTMDTLAEIMAAPEVKLIVGTGGPAMVKGLMASGKKVIAAGPGNPPSIIDDSADLEKAAVGLIASSTFDNNLLCIAEKEIFVLDSVFDEFMDILERNGNYRMTREQADQVTKTGIIVGPDGEKATNKAFVGKNANYILEQCGIHIDTDPRMAFFEAQFDDDYVQVEQMQPILPFVRCKTFEEAQEMAYEAEHDNKHSASIWTKNIDHVTSFGRLINTTVFVQNAGTMAAFGVGGTGTNSPTIATPTGEGVTGPWTFVRKRRFAIGDGGMYLL